MELVCVCLGNDCKHRAPGKGSTVCWVSSKVTYTWPCLHVPCVNKKLSLKDKILVEILVEQSLKQETWMSVSGIVYTWLSLHVPVSTKKFPPLSKMKMYILVSAVLCVNEKLVCGNKRYISGITFGLGQQRKCHPRPRSNSVFVEDKIYFLHSSGLKITNVLGHLMAHG